jgi:hypothetical protein
VHTIRVAFQDDEKMAKTSPYKTNILKKDHCNRLHLLCSYIGKISTPDANNLIAQDDENFLRKAVTNVSSLKLKKGIRTLQEIAHFIRCIPQLKCKLPEDKEILVSPDVLLTMAGG